MAVDIRDKTHLLHEDVVRLNFIKEPAAFVFRRHFRSGLRSHIMELLDPADVLREKVGIVDDGIRWFPRAVPLKMLRIFRAKFSSLDQALGEIQRVKIVEAYLGADFLAVSEEFLVDYNSPRGADVLLCGLQEYVQGEALDPWSPFPLIPTVSSAECKSEDGAASPISRNFSGARRLREAADVFVRKIKTMMRKVGVIPDLAGARNLLVTPSGKLKLVDINNISRVALNADICLDEKGYPVCDKSVEALFLLETKLVGKTPDPADEIYAHFLAPDRLRQVEEIHRRFHLALKDGRSFGC